MAIVAAGVGMKLCLGLLFLHEQQDGNSGFIQYPPKFLEEVFFVISLG